MHAHHHQGSATKFGGSNAAATPFASTKDMALAGSVLLAGNTATGLRQSTHHQLHAQLQAQQQQQQQQRFPPAPTRDEFVNQHADDLFFPQHTNDRSFDPATDRAAHHFMHHLAGPHLAQVGWASPLATAAEIFDTKIRPFFAFCRHAVPPYAFSLFETIVSADSMHAFLPPSAAAADVERALERANWQRGEAIEGMQALLVLFPRGLLGHALDILAAGAGMPQPQQQHQQGRRSAAAHRRSTMAAAAAETQRENYPIKIKCSTGVGRDRVYVVHSYAVVAGRQCSCHSFKNQVLSLSQHPTCKHVLALNLAFGFRVPTVPPPPPLDSALDRFWDQLPPTPMIDAPPSDAAIAQRKVPFDPDGDGERRANNNNDKQPAAAEDEGDEPLLFVDPQDGDSPGQARVQPQQRGGGNNNDGSNHLDGVESVGDSPNLPTPNQKLAVSPGGAVAWISETEEAVIALLTM